MNLKTFAAIFTLFLAISGCVSKPHRPDASMCGATGDCINSQGEYHEDPRLLLCTDPFSYSLLQDYIDKLELRIRELERRRCKK